MDENFGFENLIYLSESMKVVVECFKWIVFMDVGVLIIGEMGIGKDVIV